MRKQCQVLYWFEVGREKVCVCVCVYTCVFLYVYVCIYVSVFQGLDYENAKQRILVIAVNNEAPYMLAPHSQQVVQSTCTVTVNVLDIDEGPVFKPCFFRMYASECDDIGTNIGKYLAEDPETGNSEGIWYETLFSTSLFGVKQGGVWEGGISMCVYICKYMHLCRRVCVYINIHTCVYLRSLAKHQNCS